MKLRDCAKFPKKIECTDGGDIKYNDIVEDIGNLDLSELVDVDVEILAKELFEICTYPSRETWEESKDQGVWRTRAEIIADKKAKWLKARV